MVCVSIRHDKVTVYKCQFLVRKLTSFVVLISKLIVDNFEKNWFSFSMFPRYYRGTLKKMYIFLVEIHKKVMYFQIIIYNKLFCSFSRNVSIRITFLLFEPPVVNWIRHQVLKYQISWKPLGLATSKYLFYLKIDSGTIFFDQYND